MHVGNIRPLADSIFCPIFLAHFNKNWILLGVVASAQPWTPLGVGSWLDVLRLNSLFVFMLFFQNWAQSCRYHQLVDHRSASYAKQHNICQYICRERVFCFVAGCSKMFLLVGTPPSHKGIRKCCLFASNLSQGKIIRSIEFLSFGSVANQFSSIFSVLPPFLWPSTLRLNGNVHIGIDECDGNADTQKR